LHQKANVHDHFKGKNALEHLVEAHKRGLIAAEEIHGTEMPGHISACVDAAKETSLLFLLLWTLLIVLHVDSAIYHKTLILFSLGWLIWKMGRSALLGWMRLERMHRLIEEERWEIEHHRPQEREELRALYRVKGFSGQMLEEVVDVLMADDNRLLQVMLQEELGLSLEIQEHPLKQALGAGIGVLCSFAVLTIVFYWLPPLWVFLSAAALIGSSAGLAAYLERNAIIPAIVWNLSVAALAAGVAYFGCQIFQ
jgi:vacuolar iron transporter family protein